MQSLRQRGAGMRPHFARRTDGNRLWPAFCATTWAGFARTIPTGHGKVPTHVPVAALGCPAGVAIRAPIRLKCRRA